MKLESLYIKLMVKTGGNGSVETIDSILGYAGNRSSHDTWMHVRKESDTETFSDIINEFIDSITVNQEKLKLIPSYDGTTLFLEFFSEDDLGTELTSEMISRMGRIDMALAFSHYLYYSDNEVY
jgi:hypothetical protein